MLTKISYLAWTLVALAVLAGLVQVVILYREGFLDLGLAPYDYVDRVDVPSPDGKYHVFGMHLLGGATSENFTRITIRPTTESFNWRTNHCIFFAADSKPFSFSWAGDKELVIHYSPGAETVYIKKYNWKDLTFKYEPR